MKFRGHDGRWAWAAGVVFCLMAARLAPAQDWPQWRGPNGSGAASPDANPPTKWGETENVRWKVEIPGSGRSSPIVSGKYVFVETAIPVAKNAPAAAAPDDGAARPAVRLVQQERPQRGPGERAPASAAPVDAPPAGAAGSGAAGPRPPRPTSSPSSASTAPPAKPSGRKSPSRKSPTKGWATATAPTPPPPPSPTANPSTPTSAPAASTATTTKAI